MANIFHIERAANRITLGTTDTSVYLKSLTATSVPFIDTAGLIAEDSLFTWNKTTNYLSVGYLKLGGERRILANGPGANNGITINAQGSNGVFFNYVDGGTGGVYIYNGAEQKLAWFGGATRGECRVFDEDYAEWLSFSCSSGYGSLEVAGSGTPQALLLNNNAHSDVWMFQGSTSGETKGLRVYGYKAGDSKRYLDITTGGTVDDTVDFTGLSNYKFGGNVGIGVSPISQLTVEGTFTLKEQASADGDTAAYGQLWVKTVTPNELWFTDDAGTDFQLNKIIQVVNTQTQTKIYDANTTAIPHDDTKPRNNEGLEVMTCAITPTNINNKLKIEVVVNFGTSGVHRILALFQDDGTQAIATSYCNQSASQEQPETLTYFMTTGTISETTFKVRVGSELIKVTVNGIMDDTAKYDGTLTSNIVITEIKV